MFDLCKARPVVSRRRLVGVCFMGVFAAITCCLAGHGASAAEPNVTAQEVVVANEQCLAAIRSLSVHSVTSGIIADSNHPFQGAEWTWWWAGDEERLQMTAFSLPDEGKRKVKPKPAWTDTYNGPKGRIGTTGIDPASPPTLSRGSPVLAEGFMGERSSDKNAVGMNPRAQLMLAVAASIDSWSLAELAAVPDTTIVLREREESGAHLYELDIENPLHRFVIGVDPEANFMIRHVECLKPEEMKYSASVSKFRAFGDGVYLPELVTTTVGPLILTTSFSSYVVNEPLDSERFTITFPEWLLVADYKTGKYFVWGSDGPKFTFDSHDDFWAWKRPYFDEEALARVQAQNPVVASRASRAPTALIATGIMMAVLFTLVLLRRRLAHGR